MSTTRLAPWLPNPECCNVDDPQHLCPECRAMLGSDIEAALAETDWSEVDLGDDEVITPEEAAAKYRARRAEKPAMNLDQGCEDADMAPPVLDFAHPVEADAEVMAMNSLHSVMDGEPVRQPPPPSLCCEDEDTDMAPPTMNWDSDDVQDLGPVEFEDEDQEMGV